MESSARINNENLFTFYKELIINKELQLNQFELTNLNEDSE